MALDSRAAVTLVVGLLIAGLMGAFLMPIAVGQLTGPEESTATQDVDETVTLQPGLNATVTAVTDGVSATYTVEAGGDSVTGETVNVGSNSTVTVDGVDVTIAPSEATTTNATTTYDHPTTYGWGGGAGALWVIIPLILVLALFLYFVGLALGYV